jgi:hypothetical protein
VAPDRSGLLAARGNYHRFALSTLARDRDTHGGSRGDFGRAVKSRSSVPSVSWKSPGERARTRGLSQVRFRQADLMEESLGQLNFDYVVPLGRFVRSSPEKLVKNIAGALRPGRCDFHEYSH